MDSTSIVAAVLTFAELGLNLVERIGRSSSRVPNNDTHEGSPSDHVEIFSQQVQRCEELGRKLQNEPCLSKHTEVIPALSKAGEIAGDLHRIAQSFQSRDEVIRRGHTPSSAEKLHIQLQWLLPGAEMLEDVYNRLWLHLHLVRIPQSQRHSSSTNLAASEDGIVEDQDMEQDSSGWIRLQQVPIITRSDKGSVVDCVTGSNFKKRTFALVVDPKCIGLDQRVETLAGGMEAMRQVTGSMSWGLDVHGSSRSTDCSISIDRRFREYSVDNNNDRNVEGPGTMVQDENAASAIWLFSDLIEPAASRPMFGYLMRRYKVSNTLQSARAKALSRLDRILESPQRRCDRSKTPGFGSLGTVQELIACVGWMIDQSRSPASSLSFPGIEVSQKSRPEPATSHTGTSGKVGNSNGEWYSFWNSWYPANSVERHFAIRATYCVLAATRPLTVSELFAASTTMIKPGDPSWPWISEDPHNAGDHLMTLFGFLRSNEDGFVQVESEDLKVILAQQNSGLAREAHAFLASMCLKHLQEMSPRIIIWPWSRYYELQSQPDRYPLHRYVANSWQYHYGQAEPYVPDIFRQLHKLIESVWLAERTELSVQSGMGKEVDLSAYNEALDVGLMLCEAYGFKKLHSAYINMGARKHDSSSFDTFDFSDWYKVEPLDLP